MKIKVKIPFTLTLEKFVIGKTKMKCEYMSRTEITNSALKREEESLEVQLVL